MNNKKAVMIVVALIVIVIIIGGVIAGIKARHFKEEKKIEMPTEFTISYSIGGGYTTYANALTRKITLDQDGNVTIELTEKDSLVEPVKYKVDKEKAEKVMKYFYDNEFYSVKKDLSEDGITDYTTSYLEVKSNTFNRRVGGYAAGTKSIFRKFTDEFYTIVDSEVMKKFNDDVTKAYEKE